MKITGRGASLLLADSFGAAQQIPIVTKMRQSILGMLEIYN
jgi:hypothetical protein